MTPSPIPALFWLLSENKENWYNKLFGQKTLDKMNISIMLLTLIYMDFTLKYEKSELSYFCPLILSSFMEKDGILYFLQVFLFLEMSSFGEPRQGSSEKTALCCMQPCKDVY